MKTIENKNKEMNFSNEIINSRRNDARNKRNQSSQQVEKTLTKLSASNLYVATDTGPLKNLFSFKVSRSV